MLKKSKAPPSVHQVRSRSKCFLARWRSHRDACTFCGPAVKEFRALARPSQPASRVGRRANLFPARVECARSFQGWRHFAGGPNCVSWQDDCRAGDLRAESKVTRANHLAGMGARVPERVCSLDRAEKAALGSKERVKRVVICRRPPFAAAAAAAPEVGLPDNCWRRGRAREKRASERANWNASPKLMEPNLAAGINPTQVRPAQGESVYPSAPFGRASFK